jgi:hypothetical protein
MAVRRFDFSLANRLCRPQLLNVMREQDRNHSNEVQRKPNFDSDEREW